jgi:hypothetical protein
MDEYIYGVVGAGIIAKDKLLRYKRKGGIVWRQRDGKMEVWNYKLHQWVPMTQKSVPLDELMNLAGM